MSLASGRSEAPLGGGGSGTLHLERGVYGKAHQVRTDFRWLACSEAFAQERDRFEDAIKFGPIDRFVPTHLWRALGDGGFLAVATRRSRAIDAANRPTPLEREVLWLPPGTGLVPAQAAALMLRCAGQLTDDVWWAQRSDPRWRDQGHFVKAPGVQVRIDDADFARMLEEGAPVVAALADEAGGAVMTAAGVGHGDAPAVIRAERPWGVEATVGLLARLGPELATGLSIAADLASDRVALRDVQGRWDVVFTTAVVPGLAERTVGLGLAVGPDALPSWRRAKNTATPPRRVAPAPAPVPGAGPVVIDAPLVRYLLRYEGRPRYVALQELQESGLQVAPVPPRDQAAVVGRMVRLIAEYERRPARAHERPDLFADCLRAAALALVPAESTVEAVGIRDDFDFVPPHLYLPLLDEPHQALPLGRGRLARWMSRAHARFEHDDRDPLEAWWTTLELMSPSGDP